jgi:hypothetical protein
LHCLFFFFSSSRSHTLSVCVPSTPFNSECATGWTGVTCAHACPANGCTDSGTGNSSPKSGSRLR